MKQTPLKRNTPLRPLGKRGKRLAKSDKLTSLKARQEPCAAVGFEIECNGQVSPHHIVHRGDESVRNEPINILPLCAFHHSYFHANPTVEKAFLEAGWPGRIDTIRILARSDKFEKHEVLAARLIADRYCPPHLTGKESGNGSKKVREVSYD